MRRMIFLGGVLPVVAGLASLIFRVPKQVAAQHTASPAEPNDPPLLSKPWQNSPAPLIKPWRDLREEMAAP
jgi:hypothetical protein